MAIKYIHNIFKSKAHQNLPKLGFWVAKQTIWQPWKAAAAAEKKTVSAETTPFENNQLVEPASFASTFV
jgi:hypothetical protein